MAYAIKRIFQLQHVALIQNAWKKVGKLFVKKHKGWDLSIYLSISLIIL